MTDDVRAHFLRNDVFLSPNTDRSHVPGFRSHVPGRSLCQTRVHTADIPGQDNWTVSHTTSTSYVHRPYDNPFHRTYCLSRITLWIPIRHTVRMLLPPRSCKTHTRKTHSTAPFRRTLVKLSGLSRTLSWNARAVITTVHFVVMSVRDKELVDLLHRLVHMSTSDLDKNKLFDVLPGCAGFLPLAPLRLFPAPPRFGAPPKRWPACWNGRKGAGHKYLWAGAASTE